MAKFKTRARAVDMLGRQQIAGIPTAISELFKNAHDAYADRVEVDYYRFSNLFVLRDDGVGMTQDDFEQRWLTLGTESKLSRRTKLGPPPSDPDKLPRPILGEKGIGRLAIAAIGPQVLVLTRAKRKDTLGDLVAAYIHWGLFELPGVDLDEIEIPVRIFSGGNIPSFSDMEEMLSVVASNIDRLMDRIEPEEAQRFRSDLDMMRIDPVEIDTYHPEMSLSEEGHGTHFIITPAYEVLENDIDSSDGDEASSLEKLLLGFTNTMTPNHPEPVIETAFRDHTSIEYGEDLVDKDLFFTPEEFENADHHIQGQFDEFGQFNGRVVVYGDDFNNYTVAWPGAQGQQTKCGPFQVHFASVQPEARATTLPPEDHARLLAKTRRFGGLYIYREGIRILPYGDVDYDWLEIEKRRTKGAGYYYFSHRNLFGTVLLDQQKNSALSEKAGREGFRENTAYRQLRDILKNFLIQVAGDFFRSEGAYSETYEETKEELKRQAEALKRRQKLASVKRQSFAENLERFFARYDSGEPQQASLQLAERVESELEIARSIDDPRLAASRLLEIESEARRSLRELEEKYRIVRPRGLGLSRSLQREYEHHLSAYDDLQQNVFAHARSLIEGEVSGAAERARVNLDRRLRIEWALAELAEQAKSVTKAERTETTETMERVRSEVRQAARASIEEVNTAVENTLADFARIDVYSLDDGSVVDLRNQLEERILSVKEQEQEFLQYVRAQLEAINLSDDIGQLDQLEAIEQRNLALEERADYDLQLAQLGMAIEVINHEFDASVRAIRKDLRRFRAWADLNEDLEKLYQNLKASFSHLDGYLTLFTPLHRRLYREAIVITGADIFMYLCDLFERRLKRHNIEIHQTDDFRKWSTEGYPSSFYPIFVNLVDNAIFWLKDSNTPRIIKLDAQGDTVYVSNNGPVIPERRWKVVFDQGVSYKPGGRGLGLFISREVLDKIGYSIDLVPPKTEMNVTFRISPITTTTSTNGE